MLVLVPLQWITLTVIYWMERLMRPDELIAGLPPVVVLGSAFAISLLPAWLPAA